MTDWIRNRKYYPIAEAADVLKCKPMDLLHLGANGELRLCTLATGWEWHEIPTIDELDCVKRTPSPMEVIFPSIPLEGPVELPPWTLLCIEATGQATVEYLWVQDSWVRLDVSKEVSASRVFIMRSELDSLRASDPVQPASPGKPNSKEMNNLHRVIGALVRLMRSKTASGRAVSVYDNQTAIIQALVAEFPGKPGLSERHLEGAFAEGNRILDQ